MRFRTRLARQLVLFCVALSLAMSGLGATESPSESYTVEMGPPQILGSYTLRRLYDFDQDSLVAFIPIAEKERKILVEFGPDGPTARLDRLSDDDFSNDPALPFRAWESGWMRIEFDQLETPFAVEIKNEADPNRWSRQFRVYPWTERRGTLSFPDKEPIAIGVVGLGGLYQISSSALFVDLDGDSELETTSLNSPERFNFGSGAIPLFNGSWKAEVDQFGDYVTFRPAKSSDKKQYDLSLGSDAPPFSFEFDGQSFTLEDLRGKTVLLHYWATWCEHCTNELPALIRAIDTLDPAKIQVIGINSDDDPELARNYAEATGIDWPQLYGEESSRVIESYRLIGMPVYIVIGSNGKIVSSGSFGPEMTDTLYRLATEPSLYED